MTNAKNKIAIDVLSMLLVLVAIVTGFMLHNDVWHLHVYDNTTLWSVHEFVGLALTALVAAHGIQHSFWFKNYSKIRTDKKRVTTILLILGIIVAVSGVVLMCGSHSELVSHTHYVGAILFTLIAFGHVAKRWKLLKSLL